MTLLMLVWQTRQSSSSLGLVKTLLIDFLNGTDLFRSLISLLTFSKHSLE